MIESQRCQQRLCGFAAEQIHSNRVSISQFAQQTFVCFTQRFDMR